MSQVHCRAQGQRSRLSYLSHKMGIMKNMGRGHQGGVMLLHFQRDVIDEIQITVESSTFGRSLINFLIKLRHEM